MAAQETVLFVEEVLSTSRYILVNGAVQFDPDATYPVQTDDGVLVGNITNVRRETRDGYVTILGDVEYRELPHRFDFLSGYISEITMADNSTTFVKRATFRGAFARI